MEYLHIAPTSRKAYSPRSVAERASDRMVRINVTVQVTVIMPFLVYKNYLNSDIYYYELNISNFIDI